jgi:hypothetical protein
MPTKRKKAKKPAPKPKKRVAKKKPAKKKAKAKKPAARSKPRASGPPPPPPDAIEMSGIYERVMVSDTDPNAELREIFNHYDRDKSGQIEAREFARICESQGLELDDDELAAGIAVVDADGDGKVSWDEFVGWWRSLGR